MLSSQARKATRALSGLWLPDPGGGEFEAMALALTGWLLQKVSIAWIAATTFASQRVSRLLESRSAWRNS
jgi:hypothetical protein